MRLANPAEAARYVYGTLDFTLKGIKGLIDNAALTRRYSTLLYKNILQTVALQGSNDVDRTMFELNQY